MKSLLLLILFALTALAVGAQEFEPDVQKHLKNLIEKQKELKRFSAPTENEFPLLKWGETHQPGVYALPQDGMPCVVPYTADIVAIPNAFPKRELPKLGQIPNAAPRKLDLLNQKLNELKERPKQ